MLLERLEIVDCVLSALLDKQIDTSLAAMPLAVSSVGRGLLNHEQTKLEQSAPF